jgi:hypothetical protein
MRVLWESTIVANDSTASKEDHWYSITYEIHGTLKLGQLQPVRILSSTLSYLAKSGRGVATKL